MNERTRDAVRQDFPILSREVNGFPLAYFDNAATSLKPRQVSEAVNAYYTRHSANIHRGVHSLSEHATELYETTRQKVARWIGAKSPQEIVFTSGTTGSINLVARGLSSHYFNRGDEVILSHLEHHSNIVPWQMLRDSVGIELRVLPVTNNGVLDLSGLEGFLSERTKLIAVTAASNAIGTVTPVAEIARAANARNIPLLVDAAQIAPHGGIDVEKLGCDFLAFSAHKICGPTGTGVLWGKRQWLEALDPLFGGGDMILSVSFEKTIYADLPHRLEAGTPHIAGVIGLGAALDYLQGIGQETISALEKEVFDHANEALRSIPGLRVIGDSPNKVPIISFVIDGVHPHDLGTLVDQSGVAIRTGHHCAEPLMKRFGVPATARASFAFYNTHEEVTRLARAVIRAKETME